MSEAKHTPGPWTVTDASWDDEGSVRYTLTGIKHATVADALLIAAAPDLLSLVQRFVALPSAAWHPERHAAEEAELVSEARAIIAKATEPAP